MTPVTPTVKETEQTPLLEKKDEQLCENKLQENGQERQKVSLVMIIVAFITSSIGGATTTLPYTVLQTGVYGWPLVALTTAVIMTGTLYLLAISTQHYLEKTKKRKFVRDPYASVVEMVYGKTGRYFSTAVYTANSLLLGVSGTLMCAEFLKSLHQIEHVKDVNEIRLWSFVVTLLTIIISSLGYIKENEVTITVSFISSIVGLSLLLIVCSILYFKSSFEKSPPIPPVSLDGVVTAIGNLISNLCGPGLIITNIIVEAQEPEKIGLALTVSYSVILCLFALSAYIPYFIFTGSVQPIILGTLTHYTTSLSTVSVLDYIATAVLSIHIVLACAILLNPMFQHVENALNVKVGKCYLFIMR